MIIYFLFQYLMGLVILALPYLYMLLKTVCFFDIKYW